MISKDKFEEAKEALAKKGLNIFLTAKISELPQDIYHFSADDHDKTLCVIGHGGKTLWENLPHPLNPNAHSIDQYSVDLAREFAHNFLIDKIEILFPRNDLIFPLQRISRALNFSKASPLGIDISHDFGLWFAFRAAFITRKELPPSALAPLISPCESCLDHVCVSTHVISEGREKCPIAKIHAYTKEQIQYHQAVLKNN